MLNGSKARKCNVCGDIIFWKIPDGNLLGFPLVKAKEVKPYVLRENKYWCKECWEKYNEKLAKEKKRA